jgi:hypothetical protein
MAQEMPLIAKCNELTSWGGALYQRYFVDQKGDLAHQFGEAVGIVFRKESISWGCIVKGSQWPFGECLEMNKRHPAEQCLQSKPYETQACEQAVLNAARHRRTSPAHDIHSPDTSCDIR